MFFHINNMNSIPRTVAEENQFILNRSNSSKRTLFPRITSKRNRYWKAVCLRRGKFVPLNAQSFGRIVCTDFCLFVSLSVRNVHLGPVFQRPISPNPGLNFNSGFFISLFKSLLRKIFTVLFRKSNDQIASKKIWTELFLKAFGSEIKFRINPGLPLPSFEQPGPGQWIDQPLSVARLVGLFINFFYLLVCLFDRVGYYW